MFSVKITSDLEARLDPEFYSPRALESVRRIKALGAWMRLGDAMQEGYRVVYHGIDDVGGLDASDTAAFLAPTDVDSIGGFTLNQSLRVPKTYFTEYPKGIAQAGELLIEVKGNVQKLALVPSHIEVPFLVSGSFFKALFLDRIDSGYVFAFLLGRFGKILKERLCSNSIIDYIARADLESIPFPDVDAKAQLYVGNKVRQAERLRECARRLEAEVGRTHAQYTVPPSGIDFAKRTRRLAARSLTERLDAHFYPSAVEQYFEQFHGATQSLGRLCLLVTNGQTQPEAAEGLHQATVTNLGQSFVKGSLRTVQIPSKGAPTLAPHDLLLCNAAHEKSYIGRDITYSQVEGPIPSTEVMVMRVDRTQVPASFVRHHLKTQIGYLQIQSTIRGITAHSYPSDVKLIEIPIPHVADAERQAWFATDDKLLEAGRSFDAANLLTMTATQLIERLIDGHISESDLVEAQKALEAGDRQLDREILKTLRDVEEPDEKPLIKDVDALYELLAQSESTTE
jgi:type I restriction enzyme S subunit